MATRVLMFDDNQQDRFLAQRALAAEFPDLSFTQVLDQAEFDGALSRFDADAVITDLQLRWTDGLTVLRTIRESGIDAPVVMFTNTGNEEIAATGLRAGLADYVTKAPTHYARLAHAVRVAIQSASMARREHEARLREHEALQVAEEALRLKDEFLATLSHELRTPLNAIAGWVQMLKTNPSPDRSERALTVIERNTAALTRLIEDLVDVSRIVTGHLTLQVRPTDVRKAVDAALDAVRPAAQAKMVNIRIETAQRLDPVAADPDRLQQIVWNLLSNAVKFTPQGGDIHIRVRAVGRLMELRVADNGPGIQPEFLPRVFDRFSQGNAGRAPHGGMGLGLAIVRHLTEMHGGTAAVSSVPGRGATFTVMIPIANAPSGQDGGHLNA
jgi:signal transduction histidine kinase